MQTERHEDLGGKEWLIHDTTSSEVEMGQFLYGLVRMLKPDLAVETGSYVGHSTLQIARAIAENGRGKLISIDTELSYLEQARERCQDIPAEFLELRHGNVVGGLPELEEADFVFSDSGYAMRMAELERLKSGAVLVMHDTRLSFDGSFAPDHLGRVVERAGGLTFGAGRGFGILVKQ